MMTHRSKKPYECNYEACDKSYCDARSLRRHLENVHRQHPVDDLGAMPYNNEPNNQMFQFGPEYRNQFLKSQESKTWGGDAQSPSYNITSPISPHPNSPGPKLWRHPFLE